MGGRAEGGWEEKQREGTRTANERDTRREKETEREERDRGGRHVERGKEETRNGYCFISSLRALEA